MSPADFRKAAETAVDGFVGSTTRSLLLTVAVAGIGWTLKTTADHSTGLATLTSEVRGLTTTVEIHNASVDRQMSQVLDAQQSARDEMARLQAAEDMRERQENRAQRRSEPN